MVGFDFLWTLYQNSGPALQAVIIIGGAYVWLHDIRPRLNEVEQTQEQRANRWEEAGLNSQETSLLLDDAHSRIDDQEDVVQRLKERVRGIEQAYAVDHGKAPNGFTRGGGGDDADADGGAD